MRKVKFNKWIPPRKEKQDKPWETIVEGTGCFETGFQHEGLFHQWASDYDELEQGAGNLTVALIELPDGTVEKVLPEQIKFIDKPKKP